MIREIANKLKAGESVEIVNVGKGIIQVEVNKDEKKQSYLFTQRAQYTMELMEDIKIPDEKFLDDLLEEVRLTAERHNKFYRHDTD